MNELKLYFSMISGDMYYIEEDEIKNMNSSQLPLIGKPKDNCKKCHGRFHQGYEIHKKYYVPCSKCFKKYIDWSAMKHEDAIIETPRTTSEIADHDFIMEAEKGNM